MKAPKVPSSLRSPAPQRLLALATALSLAACSGSSTDDVGIGFASSVVQDLNIDPDGTTLVADLDGFSGPITFASVVTSGGQDLVNLYFDGPDVVLEFDERVAPGDQIRFIDVGGVDDGWRDVTTTDPRAPLLGILTATQDTSDTVLGGDTITVAFIGGARVVEEQVEDLANWTLTVEGVQLNLVGSTVSLDPNTQVAGITLGSLANLHADFQLSVDVETVASTRLSTAPVAGVAVGDTSPPSLEGASPVVQNLDPLTGGDEFGRVLEFDFDEPISPVFGATPANFGVVDHVEAIGITSITRVAVDLTDNTVLRVVFSRPVVPGLDQIEITGVVDAHGNPLGAMTVPIAAQGTVANSFTSVEFITQEGAGNDFVVATTAQALDPDTAARDTRWTLDVGLTTVDLSLQTLTYDLLTRTLLIQLDFDAPNGTTADLASVGATDIDGEDFTVAAAQVTASGDMSDPFVVDVSQNRAADTTGRTVDVRFSEDVDVVTATNAANYTFTPAITVNVATVVEGSTVRLDLAQAAVPGDVLVTVAQAVTDPAGNDLGADFGPAPLSSSDTVAPTAVGATGRTVEGAANDVVTILFDDLMIAAEVEDPANWSLESPIGTPLDLTGSTVSYDDVTALGTLTLDGAASPSLVNGEEYEVSLTSMRDIAGNTIDATPVGGNVTGERSLPGVESGFIVAGGSGNTLVLRFTEAMGRLDDLYDATTNPMGVRFAVVDPNTLQSTYPLTSTALDGGLGVQLVYSATIDPLATVDILGLTDLAGNVLFPVVGMALDAEDVSAPSQLAAPAVTAISGVRNDTIEIQFSVPMASWRLLSPSQYTLRETISAQVVDLTGATFTFDGTDTVTIELSDAVSGSLRSALTYDVELGVDPVDPLRSRQGIEIAATDTQAAVAVQGDVTNGPTQAGSLAMLDPSNPNALIIVFDETVDPSAALTPGDYDYNGGSVALGVTAMTDRAVRATFGGPVSAGATVDILATAAVDSAGNQAAGTLTLVVVDDQTAPVISSVTATIAGGFGGDVVEIVFDEEVDPVGAVDTDHYTVIGASGNERVGAVVYVSNESKVRLFVDDLVDGDALTIFVDGVTDLAGNLPPAPLSDSAIVVGDSVAPIIESAYVNSYLDASGRVIDVLFSEQVDTTYVGAAMNWSSSGTAFVQGVEVISSDHVQLLLSEPLGASETLTLAAGMTDPAGNEQGDQTVDPTE